MYLNLEAQMTKDTQDIKLHVGVVEKCKQCFLYGAKFVKFSWMNLQLLSSDSEEQIFAIFQDLNKLQTKLGNCSIFGYRLNSMKNGFADQRILSKDL